MNPQFWIVAGPNGAGKSTYSSDISLYAGTDSIEFINPDLLSINRRLWVDGLSVPSYVLQNKLWRLTRALYVDWPAVIMAKRKLNRLLRSNSNVAIETVLSTDKYLVDVRYARSKRYTIGMIFVCLSSWELHVHRVAQRVAEGGHSVDVDKIRSRWEKCHVMLNKFAPLMDKLMVFDNSSPGFEPVLICEKSSMNSPIDVHDRHTSPRVISSLGL